jgi:hypothetical protein
MSQTHWYDLGYGLVFTAEWAPEFPSDYEGLWWSFLRWLRFGREPDINVRVCHFPYPDIYAHRNIQDGFDEMPHAMLVWHYADDLGEKEWDDIWRERMEAVWKKRVSAT